MIIQHIPLDLLLTTLIFLRRQQLIARRVKKSETEALSDEVKAALILFVSILDERQRRLFAGLESLKLGIVNFINYLSLVMGVNCRQYFSE